MERLANLAAPLAAPGLGEVLCSIIERDISGLNTEDLVEILGDIGASEAAGSIFRMLQRRIAFDKPAYWLAQKSILALSEFGTEEADEYLRDMTRSDWPDPVRWHAAVALCVEDDLGFDEDRMLGHS
ncbi:HEAT repeat domain-containing protein [Lentzea atacamensis]|uniref:HEAT repeat domain-containing protein n=1 Tax=Lentzea atacamensis TaxID=531938 RepID=UPI000D6C11E7|nr:HEAT repeat domain-containing protein [Lentzea atacamensis]